MKPEDFYAREGEPVAPKLLALARAVLEEARLQFSGARESRTRLGRIVTFEPETVAFSGSFHVAIAGKELVSVSPGLVNGRMPMIDGVFLDGTDENGDPAPNGIPRLVCASGPGERRRSYVGIRLKLDAEALAMDEADPEALVMAHRGDLPAGFTEGGAPDEGGTAFWPVAQLTWDESGLRIVRVRQISYFDKTHRFVEVGSTWRHFFDPAA